MPELANIEFLFQLFVGEFLFAAYLPKRKYFWLRLLLGAALCMLAGYFYPLKYLSVYVIMGFFVLTIFVWLLCLKVPLLQGAFVGIAGYATQHLAGKSIQTIRVLLAYAGVGELTVVLNYVLGYSVRMVVFLAVWVLFARSLKKTELEFNNTKFLLIAAIVLFFSVFLSGRVNPEGLDVSLAVYLYAVICCCLTLFLLSGMVVRKHLEEQLAIIKRAQHQEQEQYRISKEMIELINVKCHDLKHQIRQIRAGVDDEVLGELEQAVSVYDSVVKTGNDALDVVLTEKSMHCEKNGISLSCMADGEALSFMLDTDIYSMFGNLLDNAIEAVLKLSETEERHIILDIKRIGALLSIHVENKFVGEVRIVDGYPVTTKSDKNYHGFGMRSVGMITEKYGGIMKISAENGIFATDLLFTDIANG